MFNPAYCRLEYNLSWIFESSPLKAYAPESEQLEWTDEDIRAIRIVLKKLTALRVLDANDAEDLVQDTLLTMIAKCPGSELQKSLLVWSMGVLRKKVGNYYRKAQRHASFYEKGIGTREWMQQSTQCASPELNMSHKELQAIVEAKLAQFPATQRQVMELMISGLNAGEIVKQLHPERYQNVINWLHRGRKKLAKELAKYGYCPFQKAGVRRQGRAKRSGRK